MTMTERGVDIIATSSLGDRFVPTPVVSPAGHARSFDDTLEWVRPKMRLVPIGRVFDATPLDYLGVSVWTAVTPLAKDLASHAGKGETPLAARAGAIMEAIERVSAESLPQRALVASYEELLAASDRLVLDPSTFDLPFESTYAATRQISWVTGWDLLTRQPVWVATDLVVSPAVEGVCVGAETNGLASGNTLVEATVHALYELIERDAVSCAHFVDAYGASGDEYLPPIRLIDSDSITGRARVWTDRLSKLGLSVEIRELTHDTEVPVFDVTIFDRWFPSGARSFGGSGASLNPTRALIRAITEALQSHTVDIVGSRDDFEVFPQGDQRRRSRQPRGRQVVPWSHSGGGGGPDTDLLAELEALLQRLRCCGCQHCVVVDLTREDLDVPVVRVLVPGLAHLFGLTRRRPTMRLLSRLT